MATTTLRLRTARLDELREEHGLTTQAALATAAGIDQGNLSRILNDDDPQAPSLVTAFRLAAALRTTIEDLCEVRAEVAA